VAPDLQGRGLGRELLALAEATAPASVATFWVNTGVVSEDNQRRYRRAGYRPVPGEGTWPGTVDLVKRRRQTAGPAAR
jgi:tRNA (guanine37-N1)-methyltransferase